MRPNQKPEAIYRQKSIRSFLMNCLIYYTYLSNGVFKYLCLPLAFTLSSIIYQFCTYVTDLPNTLDEVLFLICLQSLLRKNCPFKCAHALRSYKIIPINDHKHSYHDCFYRKSQMWLIKL